MTAFTLEPWRMEFAAQIVPHADNPAVARNLRNAFPQPYTESDAQAYVADCMAAPSSKQFCRAIVVEGRAVGSIGLFFQGDVYEKSAELGYWLGEPYWAKGIMSRAVAALCAEAFGRYDIIRIYAEPFATNLGSRRVLEKAGFQLEGILRNSVYKNGRVFDSCIYALLK